jgi:hypothetical protein
MSHADKGEQRDQPGQKLHFAIARSVRIAPQDFAAATGRQSPHEAPAPCPSVAGYGSKQRFLDFRTGEAIGDPFAAGGRFIEWPSQSGKCALASGVTLGGVYRR